MALRKRTPAPSKPELPDVDVKDSFRELWPTLWEFLTLWLFPETQEAREPGALLLFTNDGQLKGMLKDKDSDEVCFVSGQTLADVLDAAEAVLLAGGGDWRPDRNGSKSAGRRR